MKKFLMGILVMLCSSAIAMASPNDQKRDGHGDFLHFTLEIEGLSVATFTSVHGLDIETEIIEYRDGEDQILRKRPGSTKFSNLVLKGGTLLSNELWAWYWSVLQGRVERKSGSVVVTNSSGVEIVRYNFFHAFPCKWKGLSFDGFMMEKPVEEIELAVEEIARVSGGDQG